MKVLEWPSEDDPFLSQIMSAPVRAIGIGADTYHNMHHHQQGDVGLGASAPSSGTVTGGGGSGSGYSSGVQQGTMLTRTLYVNITGTLTNLAMAGPSGGTWKLVDGKGIGVFGMGSEVDSQVLVTPPPLPQ